MKKRTRPEDNILRDTNKDREQRRDAVIVAQGLTEKLREHLRMSQLLLDF